MVLAGAVDMFGIAKIVMYTGAAVCLFAVVHPHILESLPPVLAQLDRQHVSIFGSILVAAGYLARRLFNPKTS